MKILYVVPYLNNIGGIQSFASTIADQLRINNKVEEVDWQNKKNMLIKLLLRYLPHFVGVNLFELISKKSFYNTRILSHYNIIHFWHSDPAMFYRGTNFVVTCHGLEVTRSSLKGYRLKLYQEVFNKASLITVDSIYVKHLILSSFNIAPQKVQVITPAINFAKFANIKKPPQKRLAIGTISRFVKRKNIPNIIKALSILEKEYELDFVYQLAGDGPEKDFILSLLKNVTFKWKYLGNISEKKKIKEFYPSLDIFAMAPLDLPNDIEGFGIVYLEANAYGIPVIASRSGGVPDAVKERVSGLFADPTDPRDIAKKILKISKDKEKYRESSIAWAKKFDAPVIAKEFLKVYRSVLS